MWIIKDWAGNVLFNGKTFKTFDDGWDYILEMFPDEDEDLGDYYVTQSTRLRDTNYLDPKDPRKSKKSID